MNIEGIAAVAAQVSREYEASQAAIAERDAAETELLEALIEKVRPALPAVSSRVRSSDQSWIDSDRWGEKTYHPWRGLLVFGDGPEKSGGRDDNRCAYEGEDLYLLSDGTFAIVTWGGHFTCWSKECDELTSTFESVSVERVAHDYDVDKIVTAISEALDKQVGSRAKVVKAATERAEKVRALASLLRGGK